MGKILLGRGSWALLLFTTALAPTAGAETYTGSLGSDAGAVDVKQVTCATTDAGATYRLAIEVKSTTASAPLVSAQAVKGEKASNTTDPTSGDSDPSSTAYVAGGNGDYYVIVNKSGSGSADYTLKTECQTGKSALSPPEVSNEIKEGETAVASLVVHQGCDSGDKVFPVIAQSVVFPSNDSTSTSYRSDTGASLNLSDVISNENGLAGLLALIQTGNTFTAWDETLDSNGNSIGFQGKKGKLQGNLSGATPFLFTAPTFKSTSCANRLLVKIAVADVCKISKTPAVGQANLWIPDTTPKFSDAAVVLGSTGADRTGLPATLTINRASTLGSGCGSGYDVTVWPSDSHIDTNLPMADFWPK